MLTRRFPIALALLAGSLGAWLSASSALAADGPALPENPAMWVNSLPLSNASLKGKGVVMWFYEEQCPSCRKKWPALIEISKKYQGQPVVFIAVNSGNPRPAVESYLRENSIPWPTIVDPTREFEKAAGLRQEISLQNIHQVFVMTAEGKFQQANWDNFDGAAQTAVAGAKWNLDPTGVPQSLMPAWQALELGDYASAAPLVKKALGDKKEDVKVAATKLNDYAQSELAKAIEAAKQSTTGQEKWPTYKAFVAVATKFKGYDLPEDFKATGKELANDEGVKKEKSALESLELIKKGLNSGSQLVQKKNVEKLDKFITDHAGTEAAELAREIKGKVTR